jgi:hypothetical protein
MRDLVSKLFAVPLVLALLAVAACSGSTVVTMTATPSSDAYIAYRVGLVSIQLKTSSGKPGLMLLPSETTVDFTKLFDLSEALGAPTVPKGTYSSAVITLDYSAAQIIYDDGSLDGIELAPMASDGKALGLAIVTVSLDPNDPIRSVAKQVGRLSLNFDLAASNVVNLNENTVTVTPMMTASIQPIDAKPVRIDGPLLGANANFFATGITPFGSASAALGQISVTPSDSTTYEIDGFVSQGAPGQAQLAALPSDTLMTVFGTLSVSDALAGTLATSTTPDTPGSTADTPVSTPVSAPGTATSSAVTFTATQVLVNSAAQGVGADEITGVVSARSNDTLGIEDATLTQNGTTSLLPGTTIVVVGPSTLMTFFGQTTAEIISPQLISVGSLIDAFGTESTTSNGQPLLDASAGRVRLDLTSASGLVTAQSASALTLNLGTLGRRAISAFDFTGSGAAGDQYGVTTGSLDQTNIVVGKPAIITGFTNLFGTSAPNFTASTLLDPTTIPAELVINWSGGTAAPFTSFDANSIDLNVANGSIGPRHQIQVGAEIVNLVGLASDPIISPTSESGAIFSIGHVTSSTVESFNTFDAFITQLQSELNGITLATGMTVVGQYTESTLAFSASSITLFLNN